MSTTRQESTRVHAKPAQSQIVHAKPAQSHTDDTIDIIDSLTIHSVNSVEFYIPSDEEIKQTCVMEVKYKNIDGIQVLYDTRMGALDKQKCATCSKDVYSCIGHFGYIHLCEPIVNPLLVRKFVDILNKFCIECGKKIGDKSSSRPTTEQYCTLHESSKKFKIILTSDLELMHKRKVLTCLEICRLVDLIERTHNLPDTQRPSRYMLHALPVLPICCRIPVFINGVAHDDDLTTGYFNILRINQQCLELVDKPIEYINKVKILHFHVRSLIDNSKGKYRHVNDRIFKGIKERIGGKHGQIRTNMMGKRVDLSARSVVSAEPTLRTDEMGVPASMATTLYFRERYCKYNHAFLVDLYRRGHIQLVVKEQFYPSRTISVVSHKRKLIFTYQSVPVDKSGVPMRYMDTHHVYIYFGDIVCRDLMDGDVVLLNRQPTLHKHSMTAMKIKILPWSTFRFNLAVTKQYNADFDGDEMNLHVPMDYDSKVELEELASVRAGIMSMQQGQNVVCLVQDSVLGIYMMTRYAYPLSLELFQQLVVMSNIDMDDALYVQQYVSDSSTQLTTMHLVSLIFPRYFSYETTFMNNGTLCTVSVEHGILLKGYLNKSLLGSSPKSLISVLHGLYGADVALRFIDRSQMIANAWFTLNGCSLGIRDCMVPSHISQQIKHTIDNGLMQDKAVYGVDALDEYHTQTHLSNIRNKAMKHAHTYLLMNSRFREPIVSGAKGDFFNSTQISSLLGQQTVSGKRILPTIDHGRRTLPHQKVESSTKFKYVNAGFIRNSFFHGLSMTEYFYHSMSAREGLIDTSMKTANTGYLTRKITKLCEDVYTDKFGHVRNSTKLFNLVYGVDGVVPHSILPQ